MYDLISNIIDHSWVADLPDQELIYCICGALIVVFTVVFVDWIRDIFRSFVWRG